LYVYVLHVLLVCWGYTASASALFAIEHTMDVQPGVAATAAAAAGSVEMSLCPASMSQMMS
jgi:hypothetical protein